MCIALFSTAHPDYSLIIINNRDEYLSRPTAPASWWSSPNDHILGGRDLLRPVQGTWLGITKQGRIAVLTNFREQGQVVQSARSRGAMANAFLMLDKSSSEDTAAFAKNLVEGEGVTGVGGFSLVCGKVGKPLAVISNRTPSAEGMAWIPKGRDETIGLSNATFGDRSWYKVLEGEKLMRAAIEKSVEQKEPKEDFVMRLMELLSRDTLPKLKQNQGLESYLRELRNSILIPPIGGDAMDHISADQIAAGKGNEQVGVEQLAKVKAQQQGLSGGYGTQKQTVVLVGHDGHVTFVERTLFEGAKLVEGPGRDRWFEFDVE
ncbi:MAG: hypothetical protein LQ341_002878 [Variospora aurantia]|nr:MAG: hypothetical protein LQ341_002878 [Variospora aurantia]